MNAAFKSFGNCSGIVFRCLLALLLVCPATPLHSDELQTVAQLNRVEFQYRAEDLDTQSGCGDTAVYGPQPGSPSDYRNDRLD